MSPLRNESLATRLSLVVPQAFPGIADESLPAVLDRAAAAHGFSVFEIVAPESAADLDAVDAAAQRAGAGLILLAGLPLLRAGASLSAEGAVRRTAVDTVTAIIDRAERLGAEAVLVTTGPEPGPAHREAALDRLVESLVELAEHAASSGVVVRLEPTDTALHHRQILGSTALAVDLVERVAARGAEIDINLDLSHILQLGESPAESFALAAAHCTHVHLANCALDPAHPLVGDRHPPFGWPGTEVGVPELVAALTALHDAGYIGGLAPLVLGVEVIPPKDADPWATLRDAMEAVRAAGAASGLTR